MEQQEQRHEPARHDTRERRIYLPEYAYTDLIDDTFETVRTLEQLGAHDIHKSDYQGFRIEGSAYSYGRFTITSNAISAEARLALAGEHNAKAVYMLRSTAGETDIWINQDNPADLLLNEDIARLLDREMSAPVFDQILSLRQPSLQDIYTAIHEYSCDPRAETTIKRSALYSTQQPYGTPASPSASAKSQLTVTHSINPQRRGGGVQTGVLLERSDSLALYSDTIDRTYRFMHESTGEMHVDLLTRASSPEARALHEATYEMQIGNDQVKSSDEAIWAFNEALTALDVTR